MSNATSLIVQSGAVIKAVVSGSFNKFLKEIQDTVQQFTEMGIQVLSPTVSKPVSNVGGFVVLKTDKGSPEQIERNHLANIEKGDILYVVNPNGYIGCSAALEIGYALAKGIPVYASTSPNDTVLSALIEWRLSLPAIKESVIRRKVEDTMKPKTPFTLAGLQKHVANMVKVRGFAKETLTDVTLLMLEEMGEVAKAVRMHSGLKTEVKPDSASNSLAHELADCLIYLVDLANLAGIDLETALRQKEALNEQRTWETPPTQRPS